MVQDYVFGAFLIIILLSLPSLVVAGIAYGILRVPKRSSGNHPPGFRRAGPILIGGTARHPAGNRRASPETSPSVSYAMLCVGFVWIAASLSAWRWFPNDGGYVPATPSGVGNFLFVVAWGLFGFPAIPFSIVVLVRIWARGHFSAGLAFVLGVMAVLLAVIAAMVFPISVR